MADDSLLFVRGECLCGGSSAAPPVAGPEHVQPHSTPPPVLARPCVSCSSWQHAAATDGSDRQGWEKMREGSPGDAGGRREERTEQAAVQSDSLHMDQKQDN